MDAVCNAGGLENNGNGSRGLLGNVVLIEGSSVFCSTETDCRELHFPIHNEKGGYAKHLWLPSKLGVVSIIKVLHVIQIN